MTPQPASTVVLVRDTEGEPEILLLLRNSTLVFNGGHWVFPGGKIDVGDYAAEDAHEYAAACRAVVRETREEAGIDISGESLIHIAHWTTPEGMSRRYSTWFFLCPLISSQPVVVDQEEILDFRWIAPGAALEENRQGLIKLPFPTLKTLERLLQFNNLEAICEGMRKAEIHVFPEDSAFYTPYREG
ncbi:MAG: NUDIX hydrolase [Pseudomonadales bacterium]|nr:NUDIX hydrolase [Pseudomonadales bacterium]